MTSSNTDVEIFYDGYVAVEEGRLDRHRTEFAVTQRAIEEYLPTSPAQILDDGGGPGRYALWLAEAGHTVTLLDLSQSNLDLACAQAQQQGIPLAGTHHGSATDLGAFQDAQFDMVLLLGPLYHLVDDDERRQAVLEAKRVLKPNGILIAAFLNRYELFRYAATRDPTLLYDEEEVFESMLAIGQARFSSRPDSFANIAYWSYPVEITPFMAVCGLEQLELINCEGVVADKEEIINELQGPAWDTWVKWNYRLGKVPELLASATHILYVGRKP